MENRDNVVKMAKTVNQVVMEKTAQRAKRVDQVEEVIVVVTVNVVLKGSKDQKVNVVPLVM